MKQSSEMKNRTSEKKISPGAAESDGCELYEVYNGI